MARPLRILYPGAFYHVTSRGNERKEIFKSKRDREKFLEYLESASIRYQAVIHVFCLMDNHYHLLLETPAGNLPQIMRHINGAYTTYFNVKRNRFGHLLQGRYKAILVDKDEYAKELSRYVHLNPVRANMVDIPEEYEWSSFSYYIGNRRPPQWLFRDFILKFFGYDISSAQKKYHHFVKTAVNGDNGNPLDDVVSSTILGSPDFIDLIRENFLAEKEPDKSLPALNELQDSVSTERIFDTVEAVYDNNNGNSRQVKMYLCRKHTKLTLKHIGNHFGIGESGVCQVGRRIEKKMAGDQEFKKIVQKIEEKIMRKSVKLS